VRAYTEAMVSQLRELHKKLEKKEDAVRKRKNDAYGAVGIFNAVAKE
jgi:hypothetical protein